MKVNIIYGPPQENERVVTSVTDKSRARNLVAQMIAEGRKVRSWFNGIRFLILECQDD
jgi:hypothetical protein